MMTTHFMSFEVLHNEFHVPKDNLISIGNILVWQGFCPCGSVFAVMVFHPLGIIDWIFCQTYITISD